MPVDAWTVYLRASSATGEFVLTARQHPSRCSAFTLAEVLIASAVLAFVVGALTQAVLSGQMQNYEAILDARGMSLAESMIDEIIVLPYADPEGETTIGPDTGEVARSDFDNVDDYHGFTESAGALADFDSAALPTAYQEFDRSVTVASQSQSIAALGGTVDGVDVTVTVTHQNGRTWTVVRFVPEEAE